MMKKKEIIRKLKGLETRIDIDAPREARQYWTGYRRGLCEALGVCGQALKEFPLPWEK